MELKMIAVLIVLAACVIGLGILALDEHVRGANVPRSKWDDPKTVPPEPWRYAYWRPTFPWSKHPERQPCCSGFVRSAPAPAPDVNSVPHPTLRSHDA